MIYKVEKFIATNKLLTPRGKVLVALSGGADSVALLMALDKLEFCCEAIHCNFHLRGEESNRDEQFVQQLCKKMNIKLTTVHFDTATHAKKKGISIEMAARELRYKAFETHRTASGAEAIAVAHHRDDSAETLMLNLLRGTGIKGLRGIQPKNGHIVRPLLCVGRKEILDYLKWRGQEFVTDSTNLSNCYTRNKIRLELIPLMAEINPSILESLADTAQKISDAVNIYENAISEAVKRVKRGNKIDVKALKKEIAPASVLHNILAPLGFNSTQTKEIASALDNNSGKQFHSHEWSLIKDRDSLLIAQKSTHTAITIQLPEEGLTTTPNGNLSIKQATFDGTISKERNVATLAAEKLRTPLTLRHIKKGDRFAPFGMRGTKLVSDYLTDRKKSILQKQQQLVVTDAEGEIVWLVGERPAAPFCVDKKTEKIILFEWKSTTD